MRINRVPFFKISIIMALLLSSCSFGSRLRGMRDGADPTEAVALPPQTTQPAPQGAEESGLDIEEIIAEAGSVSEDSDPGEIPEIIEEPTLDLPEWDAQLLELEAVIEAIR